METPKTSPPSSDQPRGTRQTRAAWLLSVLLLGLLTGYGLHQAIGPLSPPSSPTAQASPAPLPSATSTLPPATPTLTPTALAVIGTLPPTPAALDFPEGLMVLAMQEGEHTQLFAYQPSRLPLTRLTDEARDHITPALSPDGHTLAYAVHTPNGWDLRLLSLTTGETTPLTNDPAYDAAPTWSPDGQWLAYEHYDDPDLNIYIRDREGQQAPIRLTSHPAADYAPAWAPQGRAIAFVSTRAGTPQVFLASLDKTGEERFQRLSRLEDGPARHPAWSADGRYVAWSQTTAGIPTLYVWDAAHPEQPPKAVGMGWWPQWAPDGSLAAVVRLPNGEALTAYRLETGLVMPFLPLRGTVTGFTLQKGALPWPLPPALARAANATPAPLWTSAANARGMEGRMNVVPLPDVEAPTPKLSDAADEAFNALRAALERKAGWDVLGTLENAFVPLTSPLPAGLGEDWLYTGRAFALPTTPMQAGWMVVVREDIAPYTYWRVFVRAAQQDGTLGQPLHALPWDFQARFSGANTAFEEGGAYAPAVPAGYWVDVTALAQAFGWERLPALPNWRTYLPAARFNEFVLRQGLSWQDAMQQIYPGQAIALPTPHATPDIPIVTPTPTATP